MWWILGAGAVMAFGYGALVATARMRYGRAPAAPPGFADPLLDRFLPQYDIVERHQIHVEAPAAVVYAAARDLDLRESIVARAIFDTRAIVLGADRTAQSSRGLVEEMLRLGWGVLAETRGREVVMGAICRPWEANVTFQPLAPDVFASFSEPGYVKIAWTLRADPQPDGSSSRFLTETRAIGTDPAARRRFRAYWSFVSPGVALIRRLSLRPVKRDAERRARHTPAATGAAPGPAAARD